MVAPGSYRPLGDVVWPHMRWVGRRLLTCPGRRSGVSRVGAPNTSPCRPSGTDSSGACLDPAHPWVPHNTPQQLLLQVNPTELGAVGQPCPWVFPTQQDRDQHNTTASPAAACVKDRPCLSFPTDSLFFITLLVCKNLPSPQTRGFKASKLERQPLLLCPTHSQVTGPPPPSCYVYLGSW